MLRAGGRRSGPVRGRRCRDRHHDGRGRRDRGLVAVLRGRCAPKVTEEVLADGLEAAKTWIRESIELQRSARGPGRARSPPSPTSCSPTTSDDVYRAGGRRGDRRRRQGQHDHREGRAQRRARRGHDVDHRRSSARSSPTVSARSRRRCARSPRRSCASGSSRRASASTVAAPRDIRPLSAEVGLLPTAHGSALFQRGETQVLNVTTLGMPRMNQLLDTIGIDEHKRYMHHYNFPPFSTGETGFMRGPKRREIGHGLLAERALLPVVPSAGGVPLHPASGVGRAVVQRVDVHGVGVRFVAVAHGRRGAHQGAGGRHRHGPRLRRGHATSP